LNNGDIASDYYPLMACTIAILFDFCNKTSSYFSLMI